MDKLGKLLYFYFLGLLVLFTLYISVMLYISPKNDAEKRGFIPCTEKFVLEVSSCPRGSVFCPLKHISKDISCNIAVVLDGFGAWIKGNQPTPWANYLFEPTNKHNDMNDINRLRKFREKKQKELEEVKHRQLKLNDNVLTSDDKEAYFSGDYDLKESQESLGDISDEVSIDITGEKNDKK